MARKETPARKITTRSTATAKSRSATSTPVRNSAVPKVQPAVRREVTHDQIAKRAYEIWRSGTGGTEQQNWLRAERELRGQS